MSRDGRGELITKDVRDDRPRSPRVMGCGAQLVLSRGGRFRRCHDGHVHCVSCGRIARRFLKGWTCGVNCEVGHA